MWNVTEILLLKYTIVMFQIFVFPNNVVSLIFRVSKVIHLFDVLTINCVKICAVRTSILRDARSPPNQDRPWRIHGFFPRNPIELGHTYHEGRWNINLQALYSWHRHVSVNVLSFKHLFIDVRFSMTFRDRKAFYASPNFL